MHGNIHRAWTIAEYWYVNCIAMESWGFSLCSLLASTNPFYGSRYHAQKLELNDQKLFLGSDLVLREISHYDKRYLSVVSFANWVVSIRVWYMTNFNRLWLFDKNPGTCTKHCFACVWNKVFIIITQRGVLTGVRCLQKLLIKGACVTHVDRLWSA
jgi:hypothetical protein